MYKASRYFRLLLIVAAMAVCGGAAAGPETDVCGRYWPAVSVPHQDVTLSSKLDENIAAVHVEEGERVRAGQVLIEFDSRVIEARIAVAEKEADFDARIARATADLDYLTREFDRNQRMGEFLSESELDKAKHAVEAARLDIENLKTQQALAEARLEYYRAEAGNYIVKSPIDGVVSRSWIEEGEMAPVGRRLLEIIAPETLEIHVHLPEACAGLDGDHPALVRFGAAGEREFQGSIHAISPRVDSSSGTFEVTVLVEPGTDEVKPGMACQVKFPHPNPAAGSARRADN